MKINRGTAIRLFHILGSIPFGCLDDNTFEAVFENTNALRDVEEDFNLIKRELFKRIYEPGSMSEEDRGKLDAFFGIIDKIGAASSDEVEALDAAAKRDYSELYAKRTREISIIKSLLDKQVDINITKVDRDAFCKGIMKCNNDIPIIELYSVFGFMFNENDESSCFSELDELLK